MTDPDWSYKGVFTGKENAMALFAFLVFLKHLKGFCPTPDLASNRVWILKCVHTIM
jgi:hypothetical protein